MELVSSEFIGCRGLALVRFSVDLCPRLWGNETAEPIEERKRGMRDQECMKKWKVGPGCLVLV